MDGGESEQGPLGAPALSIYICMSDVVKFSLGGQESALVMTNGK